MGNEEYTPYSVDSYKGFSFGTWITLENEEWLIYRIDDRTNRIMLLNPRRGFMDGDIDEVIASMKQSN